MTLNFNHQVSSPPPLPPLLTNDAKSDRVSKGPSLSPQDEVREACKRCFGPRLSSLPSVVCYYKPFEAVIQNGPICGLVGLQMAAQALDFPVPPLGQILEMGRKLNYTVQGEMFSAENLAALIQHFLPCKVEVLSDSLNSQPEIIRHLVNGNPILVPYDTDSNFEPSCKKGHKAHWAVLTGIAFVMKESSPCILNSNLVQDEFVDNLFYGRASAMSGINFYANYLELYVLAKQGKSRHLRLWSYDALQESNSNLIEVDPIKKSDPLNYIIPAGGITEGLCKKVIVTS